jgi:hypothetical protein
MAIPADWRGVETVSVSGGLVTVTERGAEKPRRLELAASPPGF